MIKLVNYIRSEVKAGVINPDVSSRSAFDSENYLLPVLNDDTLLYSLHDVIGDDLDDDDVDEDTGGVPVKALNGTSYGRKGVDRIAELELQLQRAQLEREACNKELEALSKEMKSRGRFGQNLKENTTDRGNNEQENATSNSGTGPSKNSLTLGNTDTSYFASYSGHGESSRVLKGMKTKKG